MVTRTFAVEFGPAFAGKLDSIGVTLYKADDTVLLARTTAGIEEIGGGTYTVELTYDSPRDSYYAVWDITGQAGVAAAEEFRPDSIVGPYARLFAASFGQAYAGQTATLTITEEDGTVILSTTSTGVRELQAGGAATGIYLYTIADWNISWGGLARWAIGTAVAIEPFTPDPITVIPPSSTLETHYADPQDGAVYRPAGGPTDIVVKFAPLLAGTAVALATSPAPVWSLYNASTHAAIAENQAVDGSAVATDTVTARVDLTSVEEGCYCLAVMAQTTDGERRQAALALVVR